LITRKINESFYHITGLHEELEPIIRKLTVKIPNAFFDPMIKRGLKPDSEVFYAPVKIEKFTKTLMIPSGLMPFVTNIEKSPDFTEKEILEYIKSLPIPFELYDFQIKSIVDSIINKQQINLAATSSGKSVMIAVICSFLQSKGLKGLILVPNISLTTQLHNDFKSYNLSELYDSVHLIGGDNKEKHFKNRLTIGTWQSVMKIEEQASMLDYIIVDECHGLKLNNKSTDIVYNAVHAKYRLGFTGTLPEDPIAKMAIMSCVGSPIRYIRTQGLIERGLATPVHINTLKLRYSNEDRSVFKYVGNYTKKLQFIKEHENRNEFISRLSLKIVQNGNTVIMCSHVQHMKDIFVNLMKIKFPDIDIENKNITGAKAFEFQEQYKIFYIAGATKAKDRAKIIKILKEGSNVILISNYALFSTGISIKNLKNIVFASPMKSYTTITQSIGRAIRLHISKNVAEIYDLVDDFSTRGNSGPFYKQYLDRLTKSYNTEGFPITERIIHI